LGNIINHCNLCNFSKNKHKNSSAEIYNDSQVLFIASNKFDINSEEGKMFSLILKNVLDCDISDINMLSIIKCETNMSIVDSQNEMTICKNYIIKQIDILKPKLIVTFGNSVDVILGEKIDVMKLRGTILGYNDAKLMPVYELSQILRNPSLKKDVFNDFKKIKLIMDEF
jgi:DNA polymerase